MKRNGLILSVLMGALLVLAFPALTGASEKEEPLAVYATEDGKLELADYQLNGHVIGLILDYTNTTGKNVTPAWKVNISLFQDGIEMDSGRSFDIVGVKSAYTEIRPGATLRFAEYFELDNDHPIEVEMSRVFTFSDEEPLYVKVDLDTRKTTVSNSEKSGSKSSADSLVGGILGAYGEVLNEYGKVYEEALDEYYGAIDEAVDAYSSALDEVLKGWGF